MLLKIDGRLRLCLPAVTVEAVMVELELTNPTKTLSWLPGKPVPVTVTVVAEAYDEARLLSVRAGEPEDTERVRVGPDAA